MLSLTTPRRLPLPPVETMPASVRSVAADYLKITELERAAQDRLAVLEGQRAAAAVADRSAYAAALRGGKGDPGPRQTDAVDRALATARREVDAYSEAVLTAHADAVAAVMAAQQSWLRALAEEDAAARARYAGALEELAAARVQLVDVRSRRDWLAGMPNSKVYRVTEPPVLGLTSRSGDPTSWSAVIAALRAETASPKAPQPVPAAS